MDMEPGLPITKGIVPELATKPWVTGGFAMFDPLKKGLEGKVYADHDILEDLAMDSFKFGVSFFPRAYKACQLEVRDRDMVCFPGPFTEVYRSVINKTTDVQGFGHFGYV
jgi:hypothetical protein